MDEISKYRLTGAVIWLALLILIVPGWYSNPVHFQPEGQHAEPVAERAPIVSQPYVLPIDANSVQAQQPAEHAADEVVEPKTPPTNVIAKDKSTSSPAPVIASPESRVEKGDWLVRVSAYADIRKANDDLAKLEGKFPVWIKEYTKSGVFSVRTGPYKQKAEAERDKVKIDRALHTQAELVQVK